MPAPRDPNRDLSLERLDDRDGKRPAHLGEAAHVGSSLAGASRGWEFRAVYEALIDAVFTAPGAAEWLFGLRRAMAEKENAPRGRVASDAIQKAGPAKG